MKNLSGSLATRLPRFWLARVVAVLAVTFALFGPTAAGATTGPSLVWRSAASMPVGLETPAVAAVNGVIYAIGGNNSGGNYATNYEYNPATNTWTVQASMPTPRTFFAAAAATNGKVYALGGEGTAQDLTTNEEYDPITNTWATRASMPTGRQTLGVAAGLNGKVYAIGGSSNANSLATNEEYDPATNIWATRAKMPTPRHDLALVTGFDGRLYAIGGTSNESNVPLATVEAYDPPTDTWSTVASLPQPQTALSGTTTSDGTIWAIGGITNSGIAATVQAYDVSTNTWSESTNMPTARYHEGVRSIANSVFAIGGVGGGGDLATNEWATVVATPPKLTMSPSMGPSGGSTIASGTGFRPNQSITFTRGNSTTKLPSTPCATDAHGNFSGCIVTIPRGPSGSYTINASDGVSVGSASYQISPQIQIKPPSQRVGQSVQAQGSGFKAMSTITFSVNGVLATGATCQANGQGSFSSCKFTVPTVPAGVYVAVASDGTNQAGSPLTVTP